MTRPTTHTFCKDKKGRRCTVAIRLQQKGSISIPALFEIAVAVTSKVDNFSRKIGRDIVYGRLNAAEGARIGETSGVIEDLEADQVISFLTKNFDISEKRAFLMVNKDLAVHHHHNASLIATTVPSHLIAECELTTVGNRENDLDVD